jgi:salicylate hydroxylase
MQLIQCYPVSDPHQIRPDPSHDCITDQGQGGGQAIEDSVVLGIALTNCTPEDLESRLQLFEEVRKNRASVMQIFSNAGQDEAEKIHKDAAKFIPAETVPSKPHSPMCLHPKIQTMEQN